MTDVHALSGAYAVDALDDLERAKFERHLSECPECQAEVAGLRERLRSAGRHHQVTPPPSLRESRARRDHDGPTDAASGARATQPGRIPAEFQFWWSPRPR